MRLLFYSVCSCVLSLTGCTLCRTISSFCRFVFFCSVSHKKTKMSSILRSSQHLRYFKNVARTLVCNSFIGELLTSNRAALATSFRRSLTTESGVPPQSFSSMSPPPSSSQYDLERTIRKMDLDARRLGRITMREVEDVLEELRHTKSATSSQALLIVRCCGNLIPEESPSIRTKIVNEIWNTLETLGVPLDISHYNALLRVYLENEHEFSPTDFLAKLEKRGVEPNRVTYQRLIARYCQQGDIDGATRILEYMREKLLPVNEGVFNALIMGHSKANDMESAAGILSVMQQASLEPSAETYTTLLCGYASKGDIDAVKRILEECDAKDIYFLDKDYMDVIYALAVNGYSQHVDTVIGRLKQNAGYNQDAQNLILRLINCNQEEVALKILKTMPRPTRLDGQVGRSGGFFIRHMIKINRPVEAILALCNQLESEGLNPDALSVAADLCLRLENIETGLQLLYAMQDKGFPIRQHYFWPFLVSCGKRNDENGILNIISTMTTDFNLSLSNETLKEYIVPYMSSKAPEDLVSVLRAYGVSPAAITSALVLHLLIENNIKDAVLAASKYRAYYSPTLLRKPLVQALKNTKDAKSFVSILRHVYEGLERALEHPGLLLEEDHLSGLPSRSELIGQYVIEAANVLYHDKAEIIQEVLQELVKHGLSISNSSAQILQNKLGWSLTNEISHLLDKLTSGELVVAPISRPQLQLPSQIQDENVLLNLIAGLKARGEPALGLQRQLLSVYCRNKDLEKAEKLYEDLLSFGFAPTAGVYAQFLELYAYHEKLDKVQEILDKSMKYEPPMIFEDLKVIRAITLLIKMNKYSEAIEYLKRQPNERRMIDTERSYTYNSSCWRLLNILAEEGHHEQLKELFNILSEKKYIEVSNALLGPLIKVHLVRNDVEAALTEFEMCCHQFHQTPMKNELACRLIEKEDASSLQRLTDLSTQIHGEVNSLYDLVFSFVECGRIRQARRILETPGLRSRPHKLQNVCEKFQQEGMITSLEGLLEATRDISYIDHADIYYHLLLAHCKNNDTNQALGLWTRMQEEDVQPSDEFLYHLGTYLKEQGEPVPFAVPPPPAKEEQESELSDKSSSVLSSRNLSLRRAIRDGDLDTALQLKQAMDRNSERINHVQLSQLIEGLIKADRLGESVKMTLNALNSGTIPMIRVLNFLLVRLAGIGDVESIQNIGKALSLDLMKKVSFSNRLCNAYNNSGRGHEFLQILEEEIKAAKDEDLPNLALKFPRGGIISFIQNEDWKTKFIDVAHKYADRGIISPVNVLWMDYFARGENNKAEEIWKKYLVKQDTIMYQRIIQTAYENGDATLIRKLISKLHEAQFITQQAIGAAYSALISIYVRGQDCNEAMKVVEESLERVSIDNLQKTVLKNLKLLAESAGKEFPYRIPEQDISGGISLSEDESTEDVNAEIKQQKT